MNRWNAKISALLIFLPLFFSACTRELTECEGPPLDLNTLLAMRSESFGATSGPRASLVYGNPMDVIGSPNLSMTDPRIGQSMKGYFLLDLLSPSRLQSSVVDVRISSVTDDPSTLAKPNGSGDYIFPINDVRYAQAMAYYTVTTANRYTQALGFKLQDNRPLVVLANASQGTSNTDPNAFYLHNYFDPSLPHEIEFFGNLNSFHPAQEGNVAYHERTHYVNELVSGQVGIDFIGDKGGIKSNGGGIHEALADFFSDSHFNTPEIGRWIARNFSDIPAGDPLRWAIDKSDGKSDYNTIALADGSGARPERYEMGTWVSRALWDIRSQFAKEDPKTGTIFADRLVYTAISLLSRDTSFKKFINALLSADNELHCGLHQRSIQKAFASRGWNFNAPAVNQPLILRYQAVGLSNGTNGYQVVPLAPGTQVGFNLVLTNPNSATAQNVQVTLESSDPSLHLITDKQAYGDFGPGFSEQVGSSGLPYDFSPIGQIDSGAHHGQTIQFRLHITPENGPDQVVTGQFTL